MLLTCEQITVHYGALCAVRDVSFSVAAGDYLCIVGRNGSGKSTLLRAILGLTPRTDGQVTLEPAARVGYLAQQMAVQRDFPASVMEVVLSGGLAHRGLRPWYSLGEKKRAHGVLAQLQLTGLDGVPFRDLSGGQRQRVLLARALCAGDTLLFLDEPSGGLDPGVTAVFYRLVADLNAQGVAVVMVSHDIHAALLYAGRVLHLETEVEFYGATCDYAHSVARRRLAGEM